MTPFLSSSRRPGAVIAPWMVALTILAPSSRAQSVEESPPAVTVKRDLLSIARREAEREAASLRATVDKLLGELQSSPDAGLAYISTRIDDLVAIGTLAVPQLAAAMDIDRSSSGAQNRAINATRALARIPGQPASGALARLAKDGSKHGRRYAAIGIGQRGDASLLPVLKNLLGDKDASVIVEAITGVASIGGDERRDLLVPFLSHENPALAATAMHGLAAIADGKIDGAVLLRYSKELEKIPPNEGLVYSALTYLTARPVAGSISAIAFPLSDTNSTVRVRNQAVAALLAAAQADRRNESDVIDALRKALKLGPRSVTDEAAMAMNELGSDEGLKAVTADLDSEIDSNSKNANVRYKRGEVYLRFQKWKSARRDFEAGLKIEKQQPRDPQRVHIGLARAHAGMADFRDAARQLQKLGETDLSDLPTLYPEFREMADESRYSRIFAKDGR